MCDFTQIGPTETELKQPHRGRHLPTLTYLFKGKKKIMWLKTEEALLAR